MLHYISDEKLHREFELYIRYKATAYMFSEESSVHHYLRGFCEAQKEWLERFGIDVSSERTDPLVMAEIERMEKK